MKISEENKYELFDNYVNGHMSQEETTRFRSILDNDENLAAELNLVKELYKVQEFSVQEEKLKETLSSIHTSKTGISKRIKFLALTLLIALLSFLLFQTVQKQSDGNAGNIPMAMFEPLELTTKSNEAQSNLRLMQDLYNERRYRDAMPYLLSHLEANPNDLDVLMAKGISLLEMKDYSQALDVFNHIGSLNPRVEKFKYYKALTLLKQGDNSTAKALFTEIATEKKYGYDDAKKLLETIK